NAFVQEKYPGNKKKQTTNKQVIITHAKKYIKDTLRNGYNGVFYKLEKDGDNYKLTQTKNKPREIDLTNYDNIVKYEFFKLNKEEIKSYNDEIQKLVNHRFENNPIQKVPLELIQYIISFINKIDEPELCYLALLLC